MEFHHQPTIMEDESIKPVKIAFFCRGGETAACRIGRK